MVGVHSTAVPGGWALSSLGKQMEFPTSGTLRTRRFLRGHSLPCILENVANRKAVTCQVIRLPTDLAAMGETLGNHGEQLSFGVHS